MQIIGKVTLHVAEQLIPDCCFKRSSQKQTKPPPNIHTFPFGTEWGTIEPQTILSQ